MKSSSFKWPEFDPDADRGHTVARCRDGLSAATALVVGSNIGSKRQWLRWEKYWGIQLAHAEKREKGNRNEQTQARQEVHPEG